MDSSAQPVQPQVLKRMVCLANSRKLSGRCVAGREIVKGRPGSWIRPVSDRENQEVSSEEQRYESGADPEVLDIIGVPLVGPRSAQFQTENWLLDPRYYWEKVGRVGWSDLQDFVEPGVSLWSNSESSYSGFHDRIAIDRAVQFSSSLRFVLVDQLTVVTFRPGEAFNNPKRRVQGRFKFRGIEYWLWITDPVFERRFLAVPDGTHELGECCLTVSLGEPHNGYVYKLIAAVIERATTDT